MEKDQLTELLTEQLKQSSEREKSLLEQLAKQSEQIRQQSEQLSQQSIQIQELIASIKSLEKALLEKKADNLVLAGKNRGLGKLLSNKSEKITATAQTEQPIPEVQPQGPVRIDLK